MHNLYLALLALYEVAVVVAIIHVLIDNRQPAKTMAWALVIWFVPVIGLVLYAFLGVNTRKERLISKRSLSQLGRRQMLSSVAPPVPAAGNGSEVMLIRLFERLSDSLPFRSGHVRIITDGHTYFQDLLQEIGRAKNHIHILQYIYADDALGRLLADALISKARQGVEVRIIYDDVGCWKVKHSFFEHMREAGIEAWPFLPIRFPPFFGKVNYRNHRKIIVIDGRVGYIGGYNIALRYVKGPDGKGWRDTMLRVEGQGVYGLQKSFLVDWYFVDRTMISNRKYYPEPSDAPSNGLVLQTVTSGPTSPYPEIMHGYVSAILAARRYVFIETPYFLPTEPVLMALTTAALGGIDVRIMVPRRSDSFLVGWAGRSYLREIMRAGVKVYLYGPAFLHSKVMVIDDAISTCGSTNVDGRSFESNFEANTFMYDAPTARAFRQMFEADLRSASCLNEVGPRLHPSFPVRLLESLMRLLSPLL